MLTRLSIRDIVLIDRLDINFADGLAVLTGETGAGKSILLDSFALTLGGRGDQSLVRHGAEQGQVTAVFEIAPGHPVRALLKANEIAEEDELIFRRVQYVDGRTRAFINDQPVSVQILKKLGDALVEIHGQHDDRALVDPATHRRLLDAFGALEADVENIERLWKSWHAAEKAAEAHRIQVERVRRESDWLRHAVEELDRLVPQLGEETALAERRNTMMQAEKIAEDLRETHELVSGSNSSVPALSGAIRRLERRSTQVPALIDPVVKSLDAALNALEEARTHLEAALRAADYDPAELERLEERLFALRAASRKYNVPVDDLALFAQKYKNDIVLINVGEDKLKQLESAAREAEAAYHTSAQIVSKARIRAASALDKAVNGELKPLKLERAKFTTEIVSEPNAAGPSGIDRVEFWVQTNPGTKPGPLMKIASGGELARFLLALKVALADRGSAPTLVFDEIDTGVGGAVADAIGMRLAKLARGVQVLAVTHAPQVAARADRHYVISKVSLEKGKRVATRVTELAAEHRREEIARMLAGAEITNEARAAAERLIKSAG
jgi:DNA repair protein RecN (Recombination protein N)